MQDYHQIVGDILIDEDTLKDRITELGAQISHDYQEHDLHLVCILRGGVVFLADLIRTITIPHTLDFMAISSYGVGTRKSTGQIRITMDLITAIQDRDVLLVEDIIDSGYTLKATLELLKARHPKSLHVCVLLDKAERREVEVPLRYCGFVIPDKYIFGYGLDIDEYYRNLPFIATLAPDHYKPPE